MQVLFNRETLMFFRKIVSAFIVLTFLTSLIVSPAGAQVLPIINAPQSATNAFAPPVLLGLKIHPENPLLFDFIVDQGQAKLSTDELKSETTKLVKYFLAALTIPDKEVWVNLSPTEKDRIIPDVLGQTTMGKTMLEQDYVLKQLASSLTNPETELGKKYWANVGNRHACSLQNKVWIMPAKAEVLESNGIVLVGEKRLKVMLDEEYQAVGAYCNTPLQKNVISSQIFRTTILPAIEKAVNESKDFADVRQIYNSVILAACYKKALKESLLGKIYADKGKVAGVETDDKAMKQRIYEQYLAAFKKGAYNLIKEEADENGDLIPRKYFSGGTILAMGDGASSALIARKVSFGEIRAKFSKATGAFIARVLGTEKKDEGEAISSKLRQRVTELPQDLRVTRKLRLSDLDKINAEGKAGGIYATQELLSNGIVLKVESQEMENNDTRTYRFHRNEVSILAHLNSLDVPDVPQLLEYGNVARDWRSSRMSLDDAGDLRTLLGEDQPISTSLAKWVLNQAQAIGYSSIDLFLTPEFLLNTTSDQTSNRLNTNTDTRMHEGIIRRIVSIKDFVQKLTTTAPYMKLQGLPNAKSLKDSQLWDSYSFREKLIAFISLAQMFERIHTAGVIHNDINAANILISEQPDIRGSFMIIDFSHSLLVGEEQEFTRWLGLGARHKHSIEGDLGDFAAMMWHELEKAALREGNDLPVNLVELSLEMIYPDQSSPKNMKEIRSRLETILANLELQVPVSETKAKMWAAYQKTFVLNTYISSVPLGDEIGEIKDQHVQDLVEQIKRQDRFLGLVYQHFLTTTYVDGVKTDRISMSKAQYFAVKEGLNTLGVDITYDRDNGFTLSVILLAEEPSVVLSPTNVGWNKYGDQNDKQIPDERDAKTAVELGNKITKNSLRAFIQGKPHDLLEGMGRRDMWLMLEIGASDPNRSSQYSMAGRELTEKISPNLQDISKVSGEALIRLLVARQAVSYSLDMETRPKDSGAASSGVEQGSGTTLEPVGGIDFDPTNMNLQIKRDGKGVPLPLPQQNLEQINIQGLFPVIISIMPINAETLPIFLGQAPKEPAREPELTASFAG